MKQKRLHHHILNVCPLLNVDLLKSMEILGHATQRRLSFALVFPHLSGFALHACLLPVFDLLKSPLSCLYLHAGAICLGSGRGGGRLQQSPVLQCLVRLWGRWAGLLCRQGRATVHWRPVDMSHSARVFRNVHFCLNH